METESTGAKVTAVLVHGTTLAGADQSFKPQIALEADFRVILFIRRGYDGTPSAGELGWPVDVPDLVELLQASGGGHLVGHSYGGAVVAAAASQRPDLVRSLVLVEPTLERIASAEPEVAAMLDRERQLAGGRLKMDAREYTVAWMAARFGATRQAAEAWISTWTDAELRAADVIRREGWSGDAPIDFERLAQAAFPKVVVMGAARPPMGGGSQALVSAVCTGLAQRIGADLEVFDGSTHFAPTEEPERFNDLLRRTWRR